MTLKPYILSDVATIERDGVGPEALAPGDRYVGLEHIDSEGSISSEETAATAGLKSTKFRFTVDHVLFGKLRPYLRKIARPIWSGVCSTDILPIRPGKALSRDYLCHFLRTPETVGLATQRCSGANLPRLSPKQLETFVIPLPHKNGKPDLEEQKRIAAILDKADGIRRKRQQALRLTDDFLRSVFLDMFGDPVTNPMGWALEHCGDVCSRVTVGIVVKPASYYQDSGVPALRSLNVRATGIDENNLVFFSKEDNEQKLKKTRLWTDDVVLVRSGQPGTAAIIPDHLNGANAIDILITSPIQSKVTSLYLCSYFNSPGGRRLVMAQERGQIQKHLNVKSLSEAPIPLPPLKLQARFGEIAANAFRTRDQLTTLLGESEDLFASLQQRAFRGEL